MRFVSVCRDRVFETYRFLLENVNVMFPFSTDTVTLCLKFLEYELYANTALLKMDFLIKSGSIP